MQAGPEAGPPLSQASLPCSSRNPPPSSTGGEKTLGSSDNESSFLTQLWSLGVAQFFLKSVILWISGWVSICPDSGFPGSHILGQGLGQQQQTDTSQAGEQTQNRQHLLRITQKAEMGVSYLESVWPEHSM